jgi:excisionase family DNA binding protein
MPKIEFDPDEILSVEEAATQLDIGIATAWRWIRDGKLKTIKILGRTLVPKDAIPPLKKEAEAQ